MRCEDRSRVGGGLLLLILTALLVAGPSAAGAAGPPVIGESWASQVFSSNARISVQINPNASATSYHVEYITKALHDSNEAGSKDPFTGTSRSPAVTDVGIGAGSTQQTVFQVLSGLQANTTYYYRAAAKNGQSGGAYLYGSVNFFNTQNAVAPTDTCANKPARDQQNSNFLADCRAYEMVSPIDKNGGNAGTPESIADGGVLQSASAGGRVSFSSEASFGGGAGAPVASQYIVTRGGGGWSATNISAPLFSGTYDFSSAGVPFQLFSPDLARAVMLNGDHCRGLGADCAVANPPLAGTGAPVGYQNYYLRDNGTGAFTAVLGTANSGFLSLEPSHFDIALAGTAPDLAHGVVSTCAALTATATEVPLGEGCDPAEQNLYEYGSGALTLLNATPGATLAARSGAISDDGSRVYWEDGSGAIFLHEGASNDPVGTGDFQVASGDGAFAFYIDPSGHLQRYSAAGNSSTDLTPSGGVVGALGASANGDTVYYQDGAGLRRWQSTTTTVAPGAGAALDSDFLDGGGTARVSADGNKLLFLSDERLTGYDNDDSGTGLPDTQVFLFDAGASALACVSCNPTNGRPLGPSSIPGFIANGSDPDSARSYRPRSLSANGKRVFFDSDDALVLNDTDNAIDVYQWVAQGEGGCTRVGGCVGLISGGRTAGGATFADASADGSDAFFLTSGSLVVTDPGAVDLYDARVGGGFLIPSPPIPCNGDACQPLPSEPVDPTLTTLLSGAGNPPVRYPKAIKCKKGKHKHKGKCVKDGKKKKKNKRGGAR